jgi:hypothetical protein
MQPLVMSLPSFLVPIGDTYHAKFPPVLRKATLFEVHCCVNWPLFVCSRLICPSNLARLDPLQRPATTFINCITLIHILITFPQSHFIGPPLHSSVADVTSIFSGVEKYGVYASS